MLYNGFARILNDTFPFAIIGAHLIIKDINLKDIIILSFMCKISDSVNFKKVFKCMFFV